MKEYKTIKVLLKDADEYIKTVNVFDWKVQDKEILGVKMKITLEREMGTSYYQEIKKLEKEWHKETTFPSWPTYVLSAIALVLITIYLVLFLNNQDEYGNLLFDIKQFLCFMLPRIITILIAFIYSFIRSRKINKIITLYYEKRREYSLKAQEIKGNK